MVAIPRVGSKGFLERTREIKEAVPVELIGRLMAALSETPTVMPWSRKPRTQTTSSRSEVQR